MYRAARLPLYLKYGSPEISITIMTTKAGDPLMLHEWEQRRIDIYDVKEQLRQYVYGKSMEAFAAGDKARDAVTDAVRAEARRRHMRELLLDGIGGLPPRDTPLEPVVTGTVRRDGYRIEKIVFQSLPQLYATAHLYVPDGRASPDGAVLFVCGHGPEGKLYPSYQRVCQCLVRAGLVVLALDPLGQGERLGYCDAGDDKPFARRVAEHEHVGVQCWPLGDGLARYFIHDIARAVDYLCTRPEVDPAKIGITGSSGGGTQTSLAMICEPRFAAAAPGTFIMNRESYLFAGQAQDAEQIWPNMSAAGFDHEDILLAMAPRPVLVLAVTGDIFPIEGTRRTVERSRKFWDMHGCGDRLQLAVDESPHMYTLPLARAAAAFFAKHLLGKQIEADDGEYLVEDGSDIWCTTSGQIVGDYPGARKVYHENLDRLAGLEKARAATPEAERKAKATAWLDGRVRGPRPVCDLNPRHQRLRSWHGLNVQSSIWWSQPGLFSHGFLFSPSAGPTDSPHIPGGGSADRSAADTTQVIGTASAANAASTTGAADTASAAGTANMASTANPANTTNATGTKGAVRGTLPKRPLTIAVWDGGTTRLQEHEQWLLDRCRAGEAVLVLDVAGSGALTPNAINGKPLRGVFGTLHKLNMDLFWLGDSLAALRAYDVLRAVDFARSLHETDPTNIRLYAEGRFGVYAEWAHALLEPAGMPLETAHEWESVASWVRSEYYDNTGIGEYVLPGMLHHFDLPDLRAWREKASYSNKGELQCVEQK